MNVMQKFLLFSMSLILWNNVIDCKAKKDNTKNCAIKPNLSKTAKVTTDIPASKKINTSDLIDEMYKNIKHQISDTERSMVTKTGGSPVYGEIKFDSLKKVLDDLNIKKTDVLYDLGSGTGKVLVQGYLDYPFKKVVGIELSPTRNHHAETIRKNLEKKNLITKDRKFELYNGDIAKENISDATVIYMCSTCYPEELMAKLTERFSKLKPGLTVITLKALPDNYEDFGLKHIKEYKLPMTWSEGSPVHIYKLEGKAKKAAKKAKK